MKGNGLQICYCETNADCPTGKTCGVVPPFNIKRCSH